VTGTTATVANTSATRASTSDKALSIATHLRRHSSHSPTRARLHRPLRHHTAPRLPLCRAEGCNNDASSDDLDIQAHFFQQQFDRGRLKLGPPGGCKVNHWATRDRSRAATSTEHHKCPRFPLHRHCFKPESPSTASILVQDHASATTASAFSSPTIPQLPLFLFITFTLWTAFPFLSVGTNSCI
jgi:hypothetical protein